MNQEQELIELNIELAQNPHNEGAKKAKVTLLCHKANTSASNDKLDEAIMFVDHALELEPNNTVLLLNKADYFSKQNKFKEASELASKAFQLEPQNYAARHALVVNLNNAFEGDMECGNHADALVNIDKALALEPKDKYVMYNRAATLWNLGRYEEALESAEKTADMDPKFSSPRTLKAIILNHMALKDSEEGRHEDALKKVEEAIKLKPNEAAFHVNRASFLVESAQFKETKEATEQFKEAKKEVEFALELDADNKDAHFLKDVIHRKTQHFIVKEPRRVSIGYVPQH